MSMRVLLASLLTASAVFASAPAMASPLLDELEIALQGEAQGWLNATCTYYDLGWISEEQGRYAVLRLTKTSRVNISEMTLSIRPRRRP